MLHTCAVIYNMSKYKKEKIQIKGQNEENLHGYKSEASGLQILHQSNIASHECIYSCSTAGNVFLWDRLGAASAGPISPYLANFVTKKAAVAKPAKQISRSIAKGGSRKAGTRDSGPSLAEILAEVHSAVEGVIGTQANGDQPLMEAGLDSLGNLQATPLSTQSCKRFNGSV